MLSFLSLIQIEILQSDTFISRQLILVVICIPRNIQQLLVALQSLFIEFQFFVNVGKLPDNYHVVRWSFVSPTKAFKFLEYAGRLCKVLELKRNQTVGSHYPVEHMPFGFVADGEDVTGFFEDFVDCCKFHVPRFFRDWVQDCLAFVQDYFCVQHLFSSQLLCFRLFYTNPTNMHVVLLQLIFSSVSRFLVSAYISIN